MVVIWCVLLHSFTDLLASDLTTITKYDNLDLRQGIQLYDPIAQSEEVQKDQGLVIASLCFNFSKLDTNLAQISILCCYAATNTDFIYENILCF